MSVHYHKTLQAVLVTWTVFLFIRTDSCGDLPTVPHASPAEKLVPPFVAGSAVGYDCVGGYTAVNGSHLAVCQQENGTTYWKPPTLQCELEGCGPLPQLQRGVPEETDEPRRPPFPLGTTVWYVCDTGYRSEGGSTAAVCIRKDDRAQWEPPKFTCRGVSCNDPKLVRHADRIGHVFEFPHNVTFVCHEGYETDDPVVLHCLPNTVWSRDRPVCKAVQCPELANPDNGVADAKELTYRSTVRYRCDDGYRLEGLVERECLANKTWSGMPPNCTKVTCPPIILVPNGRAIKLHSKGVIITCNAPDITRVTVSCLNNGQWDPPIPICKEKPTTVTPPSTKAPVLIVTEPPKQPVLTMQCGNPGNISHGRASDYNETLPVNFNLTYSCLPGYVMNGHSVLTCNSLGKWTPGIVPACQKPLTVEVIVGIVMGSIALLMLLVASGFFCVRWRKRQLMHRNKACIIDAKDMEEIRSLERNKKYIPVTSL